MVHSFQRAIERSRIASGRPLGLNLRLEWIGVGLENRRLAAGIRIAKFAVEQNQAQNANRTPETSSKAHIAPTPWSIGALVVRYAVVPLDTLLATWEHARG
jgi:hypothetical protein